MLIAVIMIIIAICNLFYTIFSMWKFMWKIKKNSLKIHLLIPNFMLIFEICLFTISFFNLYYYLVKNEIANLLSFVMCFIFANQILTSSFYSLSDDSFLVNNKIIKLEKINKIEIKKTFVFQFLEIAVIHIDNMPQFSVFISKKAKEKFLKGNWNKVKK